MTAAGIYRPLRGTRNDEDRRRQVAGSGFAQSGALIQTDANTFRARVRQMLGPSIVGRVRRLSRFPGMRALIHPDPEVKRWIEIAWRTADETGFKVASGPFKGLDLEPVGEPGLMTIRELLGIYEEELHPWIETLVAHGYRNVIDIGAARGYYAVGLAIRMPNARVVAFEEQKAQAEVLTQVAERNGVSSRIAVRGHCDHQSLAAALEGREGVLIVSDCEGAEFDLLDASRLPALVSCDILAEVHGHLGAGLAIQLEQRFQETHWLLRMMPKGAKRGAGVQGALTAAPNVPAEWRPEGAYWLLLLRRDTWPLQAAISG